MIQHVLEPRYKKAILELVGQLSSDKPRRVNTMVFCQRHDVDNRFFQALEEIGAIKSKGEAGIDVYEYVRMGALMKLSAADVLQKLGIGNPSVAETAASIVVDAEKKAKPVIEFFDPADNEPADEPPKLEKGIQVVLPLPSSASEVLHKLEEAVSKSAGVTVVESEKVKALREYGQRERDALTKAAKETQSGCKGNCKGPATYPDLSVDGAAVLECWHNPAEKPLPPFDAQTKPGYPIFPDIAPSLPMLKSNADMVMYVVDMIVAHCGDEPHDQEAVMVSIQDRLAVQQQVRAQQLQDEAEAMISRSQTYLKTAANIRPTYAHD
ncbi:hypothetical protein FAES_1847 [Fibrella aestuarina BUZ 2]|uniref:Uncharacterized protein n=1 Tax=Fibrella aestuarina BUZ 2 TaxID=1166018 RepID=I0K6V4_9BACT|nr:hypothetical protein [Fibrella aestuarina]CCG99857.1 hypothetical protein FAES_1847 [Fibrella aestuarina BUZ 2]